MTQTSFSEVGALAEKPGRDWSNEERAIVRAWLFSEKWHDMQRAVEKAVGKCPADHAAGVMATFLDGKLDSIMQGYEPGHSGVWPYVLVCLRHHCWRAATPLNLERGLTRAPSSQPETAEVPDDGQCPGGDPPQALLEKDLYSLVQRELKSLADIYRAPLVRRIRGASYDEIARDLGLSRMVVKIRIYRARQELRRCLRAAWPSKLF